MFLTTEFQSGLVSTNPWHPQCSVLWCSKCQKHILIVSKAIQCLLDSAIRGKSGILRKLLLANPEGEKEIVVLASFARLTRFLHVNYGTCAIIFCQADWMVARFKLTPPQDTHLSLPDSQFLHFPGSGFGLACIGHHGHQGTQFALITRNRSLNTRPHISDHPLWELK
jgi:hypothetical protein